MRKLLTLLLILVLSISGFTAPIYVGGTGTSGNLGSNINQNFVSIEKSPATGTGKLDKLYIYVATAITNAVISTIYETTTNRFTSRDYQVIGSIATGARVIDIDLDVEEGDYLALEHASGTYTYDMNGSGAWAISGTGEIPLNNRNISTWVDGIRVGYHATGSTEDDDTIYIGKWNTKQTTGIKWNGIIPIWNTYPWEE